MSIFFIAIQSYFDAAASMAFMVPPVPYYDDPPPQVVLSELMGGSQLGGMLGQPAALDAQQRLNGLRELVGEK